MARFSANLGYLWTDRALPDAILAAGAAGFDAVECQWPYEVPPAAVVAALEEAGVPVLGVNAPRGDVDRGDRGLAAVPGREAEARQSIDQAVDYADAIGAANIHVLAGTAEGETALEVFLETLAYACDVAGAKGKTILIEPLNEGDAPGYFLRTTGQAADIIGKVGARNLAIMFDCYHVGRTEGDVIGRLHKVFPMIGHIQFAGVPDRGPPDQGTVDYASVFAAIDALGWTQPLGAEYRPGGDTDASLGWLADYSAAP